MWPHGPNGGTLRPCLSLAEVRFKPSGVSNARIFPSTMMDATAKFGLVHIVRRDEDGDTLVGSLMISSQNWRRVLGSTSGRFVEEHDVRTVERGHGKSQLCFHPKGNDLTIVFRSASSPNVCSTSSVRQAITSSESP